MSGTELVPLDSSKRVIARAIADDDIETLFTLLALKWFKDVCSRYGRDVVDLQHLKEHCKDLLSITYYIDIKTRKQGQTNWAIEEGCLTVKDLPVAFYLIDGDSPSSFRLLDVWWQERVRRAVGEATPRPPTETGSNDSWYLLTEACVVI